MNQKIIFPFIIYVIATAYLVPLQAQVAFGIGGKKAEEIKFQKDENGKIVFYEVVTTDTVPRDTLWKNAMIWTKSILNEKTDKITFENQLYGTIEAETGFMLYIPSLISKMPHGRLTYKVTLDIKDRKYRYTFSDFVFQYYKQDRRDFTYKPVKGSLRPLEKQKYPGYQSAWNHHKVTVKEHIEGQIATLKAEMVKMNKERPDSQTDSDKPVKRTKDW